MLKEFQQFLIVSLDLATDCGLRDDPLSFVLLSLLARCFQRIKILHRLEEFIEKGLNHANKQFYVLKN